MSEHDFEPVRGLPAPLPEGETLLWQGAPHWWGLARRVFHVPLVALYFLALAGWRAATSLSGGGDAGAALTSALWTLPLAGVALALLMGLAWLNARTTVYTITTRRVIMRFGAALTKAINIPFAIIESAALKADRGLEGDLALKLCPPNKIAYLLLWPHARPDRLRAPEPTLRCLANAQAAAAVLAEALRKAHDQKHALTETAPAPAPAAATPVAARPEPVSSEAKAQDPPGFGRPAMA